MIPKFIIVGKGGVGKSTIATLIGKKYNVPIIIVDQQRNVIDFDPNCNELKLRLEYCGQLVDDFLHSNGLLASLEKLSSVIAQDFSIMLAMCDAMARAENGFVIDMPPNTSALKMLTFPNLFDTKVVKALTLKNRIKEMTGKTDPGLEAIRIMREMFNVGKTCMENAQFIPITTPEDVAVIETQKLITFLRGENFPIHSIILNRKRNYSKGCDYCTSAYHKQIKVGNDLGNMAKHFKVVLIPEVLDPMSEIEPFLDL